MRILVLILIGSFLSACNGSSGKGKGGDDFQLKSSSLFKVEEILIDLEVTQGSSTPGKSVDCLARLSIEKEKNHYEAIALGNGDSVVCEGSPVTEDWQQFGDVRWFLGYKTTVAQRADNLYRISFVRNGKSYENRVSLPETGVDHVSISPLQGLKPQETLTVLWEDALTAKDIANQAFREISVTVSDGTTNYTYGRIIYEDSNLPVEFNPIDFGKKVIWPNNVELSMSISISRKLQSPLVGSLRSSKQQKIKIPVL